MLKLKRAEGSTEISTNKKYQGYEILDKNSKRYYEIKKDIDQINIYLYLQISE